MSVSLNNFKIIGNGKVRAMLLHPVRRDEYAGWEDI
jgi:hypothetical protein